MYLNKLKRYNAYSDNLFDDCTVVDSGIGRDRNVVPAGTGPG